MLGNSIDKLAVEIRINTQLPATDGGFGAVMRLQLAEDVIDVALDGVA